MPLERWLTTMAFRQIGSGDWNYETAEIDEHPSEYLMKLREGGNFASVAITFAMKLNPEDPVLET